MLEPTDTVWKAEPHTIAKHKVLTGYLSAWAPIMAQRAHKFPGEHLRVIDGFAGPGIYSSGEKGSPILALTAILDHSLDIPCPVNFDFIDNDVRRVESLRTQVGLLQESIDQSDRIGAVRCHENECDELIQKWLDECERDRRHFGPCFCFLDQFGYSNVSLKLIQRIMNHRACETFSYLAWAQMNHYVTDETKWSAIDRAFGGDHWREIFSKPRSDWPNLMPTLYKKSLMELANVKFVWHMAMGTQHQLSHWLFYCTNNEKGLEEMKKAMKRVDPTGEFRFADSDDPSQYNLFNSYNDTNLENDLFRKYKGQTRQIGEVQFFVLTETPATSFRRLLGKLERAGKITPVSPPPSRRKADFSNPQLLIRFN